MLQTNQESKQEPNDARSKLNTVWMQFLEKQILSAEQEKQQQTRLRNNGALKFIIQIYRQRVLINIITCVKEQNVE